MIKRAFSWVKSNLLFVETLVLLAFIPLYPKIPLIGVTNTWVYIRAEDFLIFGVLLSWLALLVRKKISLRTPLTFPILIYWLIGIVATIHGILLIFPTISNVFPNVAFLSLLRHIEYLSLFFIAYQGMKDRKLLYTLITAVILTLLAIIGYGFGQKYFGFPAFLTGNEEFAKGIPIQLSQLSRVPSTFAGHYDLAAYLVLMIPLLTSIFFGVRNYLIKAIILLTTLGSFWLLFMTVSRVSLVVVFVSLFIVLFFQKRRLALMSIPLIVIAALVVLSLKPTVLQRFQNTVETVDVLVDAETGNSIGHVQFVPREFFEDKIVLSQRIDNEEELVKVLKGEDTASASAIFPYRLIPKEAALVRNVNLSTGENLPSGTGYINLTLSPVVRSLDNFFYEFPPDLAASPSAQHLVLHGNFIVKKAAAYDLSFTTRFQGEWPKAIEAFQRNIFLGSGFSAVTLAVDNNYLRILGEIGILGFLAFLSIFFSFWIYLRKVWKQMSFGIEKSFLLGFGAGLIGLALNGLLIDVFEASKVAYTLWILMGVAMAIIVFNLKSDLNLLDEFKKAATSTYAVIFYLLGVIMLIYVPAAGNFFIGDDFTWLRWAALSVNPLSYFTESDGFFFRPGAKIYFDLMYNAFWLNPAVYHLVSIGLHFLIAVLFFLLSKKIFRNTLLAVFSSIGFLVLSGYSETVLWISATGHLFTALFGLLGLLLFIKWEDTRRTFYYLLSFVSFALALLFHELGVVLPLLVLAYRLKDNEWSLRSFIEQIKKSDFLFLFIPVAFYLILRLLANSHWFSGDYNYDLFKLPFNFVGNLLGYGAISFLGPSVLAAYEGIRTLLRENILLSLVLVTVGIALLFVIVRATKSLFDNKEKRILFFGLSFFVISLLPYLGLGNITLRYSYLATMGVIFILVILFRKIYGFLLTSGRNIALPSITLLLLLYGLFHLISFQQSAADWAGASFRVKNFFVSFDSYYRNYWSRDEVNFHFVDVPIKRGQAWIFPVGLSDAVWFAVRNEKANVFIHKDVGTALQNVENPLRDRIFVFDDLGMLEEVKIKVTNDNEIDS
jgi:hypothetical protein